MNWEGERVVVIGAARQGTALARYLAEHGAEVILTDSRPEEQLNQAREELAHLPITWVLGEHPMKLLDGATLICPSGGVPLTIPLVHETSRVGIPLSNDSQIFMQAVPCPVIGITGSAGKTTTTTLVGRMAEKAAEAGLYRKAYVGGNIGFPLISQVEEMTAKDIAVVEFSSFQLDLMTTSPKVAAVLNITPNHLDRHGSMDAYVNAKRHILAHQGPEDAAVLGYEDARAWELAQEAEGLLYAFGRDIPYGLPGTFVWNDQVWVRTDAGDEAVMPVSEISLRGEHNLLNVLAACAIAAASGWPVEIMRAGVKAFSGVEHRLEFVRTWGGADWYNDSKATSPGMSITAMQAFEEPLVILAGGRDKDLPWDGFATQVQAQADHVILFGEAAEKIRAALEQVKQQNDRTYSLDICPGLDEAVKTAAGLARPGDVVLLAPGGTSFDEFNDFEARGRRFKQLVNQLPEKE
ncbi:MAG TPA: UDP-N-acetylmuramoyl-L-alanine--D-glutamate ligase [Anaerolineales bacterium]|jgi:UDP-N-acetylmuramoylalanine--D-glutamate ligase|nr:UDP-N-acetylmuramoyl-L-alanine--D-glutamate ligase [Anaerolineales bacterium]